MVARAADQGGDRCHRDPVDSLGSVPGSRPQHDPLRAGLGLALFVVGLGFAIWARVNIGRNWGTPMTQKDEPELVTSGPYRLVRHPIYSGILVAGCRHRRGAELAVVDRRGTGRDLLHLQRDRRGALPG